jgi:Domain of unknown function (DUF1990)
MTSSSSKESIGLARRIGTVARWPLGMGLASWRYLWRVSPLHRTDEEGTPHDVGPPVRNAGGDLQRAEDGIGALFHRKYSVRIEGSSMTPEELIDTIAQNPNRAAPVEVAFFHKTRGRAWALELGDEFIVRMPGPWDGPVRVIDRGPRSFRFITLAGHLEAGQIEFRAVQDDSAIRFEIESWARSGDRLSELLFDRIRIVKELQLHMWTHFCERVGRLAGGRVRGGIHVDTRRLQELPGA